MLCAVVAFWGGKIQATGWVVGGHYNGSSWSVVSTCAISVYPETPAWIQLHPSNIEQNVGSNAWLRVTAGGSEPFSYQWRCNGTNLPEATNSGLYFSFLLPAHGGNYDVVVTNPFGAVTSSVAAVVVHAYPPSFLRRPYSFSAAEGGSVQFDARTTGSPPLQHQWSFNGAPIAGATNRKLGLANLQPAQAGEYQLVASNPYGSVTSTVTLTVSTAIRQVWETGYGGPGTSNDFASALVVDDAGNVYITGGSHGYDEGTDYTTIKYNANGGQVWMVRYSYFSNSFDAPVALAVDTLGNVYVTGRSMSPDAGYDYATIKYDPEGNQLWATRYSGPGDDRATALALDSFGNVFVTGYSSNATTSYDYLTIKYDSNGKELWTRRYDGPIHYQDRANALAVDQAGNVYVTGYSMGFHTGRDYATVKYDPEGNELWVARYNGPEKTEDSASAVAVDNLGNVYVTGTSSNAVSGADYLTVKYDAAGNQLWANPYNGPGNASDMANTLVVDVSGNVYVTGTSADTVNGTDYATIKYDSAGNQIWAARYDGEGKADDCATGLALDAAGQVYVSGSSTGAGTGTDYATVKYHTNGNQLWTARYNGSGSTNDSANAVAVDGAGRVYVTGYTSGGNTALDYTTLRYDAEGKQLWATDYQGDGGDLRIFLEGAVLDSTGNVFVTGTIWVTPRGDYDTVTIKYNSNGVQCWIATYNSPADGNDFPGSPILDRSGNVYVLNRIDLRGGGCSWAIIKYDQEGNQLFALTNSDPVSTYTGPNAILFDQQENLYLIGIARHYSTNYLDYMVLKADPQGNKLWESYYNGPANLNDDLRAWAVDASGNVYLTGSSYTAMNAGQYASEFATVKFDADGRQLWEARYAGPMLGSYSPNRLVVDGAGNVYVTGLGGVLGTNVVESENDDSLYTNVFIYEAATTIKYAPDGRQLWSAQYRSSTNSSEYGNGLTLDNAGNVYVVASSYQPLIGHSFVTIKYDSNGSQLWDSHYPMALGYSSVDLVVDSEGDLYVGSDYYGTILKYGSQGNLLWVSSSSASRSSHLLLDGSNNLYFLGTYNHDSSRISITKYVQATTPETRLSFSPTLAGDSCSVQVLGEAGRLYELQSSSNLLDWSSIQSAFNPSGTLLFTNLINDGRHFYRAVKQP